jgi:integrase
VKDKSRAKSARKTEQHDILGGKAIILRTAASGQVWQFRMWVSEEKKYVRETLKTRDLKTAVQRAEERYLRLYSDIASGRKLFGITVGQLIALYLEWRAKDVAGGSITAGRLVTITSQLKHLRHYKGEETGISELDRNSLFDYAQWRRTEAGAHDVTIRNEQATINHLMRYAYRNGYAHFDKFEFASLKIREVARRDIFELEEYDALVRYLRKWVSNNEVQDDQQRLERLMIRDCLFAASNTMLRVGELWQLKWGRRCRARERS